MTAKRENKQGPNVTFKIRLHFLNKNLMLMHFWLSQSGTKIKDQIGTLDLALGPDPVNLDQKLNDNNHNTS